MASHLSLTDLEKEQLLLLSRNAIQYCFEASGRGHSLFAAPINLADCEKVLFKEYSDQDIPVLQETLTCFVTLYTLENDDRRLRGCIGTVEARSGETLLENLISNSIMAAFKDSRFEPLQEKDLATTLIEISILSQPRPIEFKTKEALFSLIRGKGVVLQAGINRATYLPQVWEQISEPEEFLSHLARKAGIFSGDYLNTSFEIYEVYSFEDSE